MLQVMVQCRRSTILTLALSLVCSVAAAAPKPSQLDTLELTDLYGQPHQIAEYRTGNWTVVTFLGTECPLVRLYARRLSDLADEFSSRGVSFIGVNSNCQDSLTEISAYGRRHDLTIPLLKDVGHHLANALGAERTPQVFVLDRDNNIHYQGRIDDQYGVGFSREKPTRQDLRLALDALTSGRPVEVPRTEAAGCHIGRLPNPSDDATVTYSDQIARIFQKHCVECHRDGQIAPFALTDYDEAVGWAETIAEVIRDRRMPPWHASTAYGDFKNARLMSDAEKELVYEWVDSGAPAGDAANLPEPETYVSGWRLPKDPDLVLEMRSRPFPIPAEGTVEYQYFVVDPGFESEKWIKSAEVIPGNFNVVHHCIVFVRPPDANGLRGFGWLAAYVPGQAPIVLPPGMARRVPAGSKLVFQMHYTPNGIPQQDNTKLGIVFTDETEVEKEIVTLGALNRSFEIPPGAKDFKVETTMDWFPKGGQVVSLAPHMHVRGRSFRFIAEDGDNRRILLDVPDYDFNWQHVYELREPLPLSENTLIRCIARFDNSADNLVNPDPTASVTWGDQTWEEMMVGFVDVAVSRDTQIKLPWETDEGDEPANEDEIDEFFKRFDIDKDGFVHREEVPTTFAVFAFWRFDDNNDSMLDRAEASEIAGR